MTRRPRARPGLALVGVLSIAFVLLPAAGIAYLGAISYQEDRGLVAAKLEEQYQAAVAVSSAVEDSIAGTLEQLAAIADAREIPAEAIAAFRERAGLFAFPFIISNSGRLLFPAPEPLRRPAAERPDFLSRVPKSCPERGFDTCIKAIRAARRRLTQLHTARRHEFGPCAPESVPGGVKDGVPDGMKDGVPNGTIDGGPACVPHAKDLDTARRAYANLARFDDTGPDALLGLARMAARAGEVDAAVAHYQDLGRRFGSRLDPDNVSYRLLADLGAAEARADAPAFLALYHALLSPTYEAPSSLLEHIAESVRDRLERMPLTADARAELERANARFEDARKQALFAAALAPEIDDLVRTAGAEIRGRPPLAAPERTILYRALDAGLIIGVLADTPMLEREAEKADAALARLSPGTHAVIERPGDAARRAVHTRTLAQTGFGPILPHLSLALVHDRNLPDPLDAIIEARGRRHLAITGSLVALLIFGLIATIRSAARERELARLKSDFVSTVSHELKTPLTSIRMFGEMLQQGVAAGDREREARYHDIIVKESQRLGLLIANLLDYSQIERGTRRYNPHPERAADLLRDAVDTFERFREEPSGIRVHVDQSAEKAEILVDREVLVQSLLNLLGNALKYGAPPVEVSATLDRERDRVLLAVTDHGPGIPPGDRERIFREFYRAPAAYSAGVEGTGLGLALVKRHVEAQGGAVDVTGEPGRGVTFTIRFPRC